MRRKTLLLLTIFCLLDYTPAAAHQGQVCAAAEEGIIKNETTLSGRHPVREGEIWGFSSDNQKLLLTLASDTAGSFTIDSRDLRLEQPTDLVIALEGGAKEMETGAGLWIYTHEYRFR